MSSCQTTGFVYVATGEKYRREAAASAASLRAATPGARVCLVTDKVEGPAFWDDVVLHEQPVFSFRDKMAMRLCPYERFVFLDTDTLIIGDLSEVFQMLERFDFAGHQLFEGHDCPLPGIPDAFPEFNTGVLGFRRSPAVERFFDQWAANFDAFFAQNRDGQYHYSNVSDQKSLRKSIWDSGLSVGVLGPEYNFVPHHVNFACAPVRVLHTRGEAARASLRARINVALGNRAYIPRLDAVLINDPLPAELRHLWWMTTLQLGRRAGRKLMPMGARNLLRQMPIMRRLFLASPIDEAKQARDPKWRQPD